MPASDSKKSTRVSSAPTQTTNITGLRICTRGSSLRNELAAASRIEAPVVGGALGFARRFIHQRTITRCSTIGPSASAGKKLRAPTTMITAISRPDEQRSVGAQRAGALRDELLLGQRAGDGQRGQDDPEAADEHDHAQGDVVEAACWRSVRRRRCRCCRPPRRRRTGPRSTRAGPDWRCRPCRRSVETATAVPNRISTTGMRMMSDGHLHLVHLDLLAQVLGRSPHHEPGDEDGDDGEDKDAVEARPHAAEDHLAQLDEHQRDHAAQRACTSRAWSSPSRWRWRRWTAAHMADAPMPKRVSLPSMLPPGCAPAPDATAWMFAPGGRLLGHAPGLEGVRGGDHGRRARSSSRRTRPSPAGCCPPCGRRCR